jgi:ATP-dependent 26S proteasome regulatory subunit
MTTTATNNWHEANQRYLSAAVATVRGMLEQRIARLQGSAQPGEWDDTAQQALQELTNGMTAPPALETLCTAFDLTPFERHVLLLCTGAEFDTTFASRCAAAQGDTSRTYPTFSLALATLPGAHWSALSPGAPLRRWRLIEVGTGNVLTQSPLHIDERVLHYLVGVQHMDERLVGIIEPVNGGGDLIPSQRLLADQLAASWPQTVGESAFPLVQLCGDDLVGKRAVAQAACNGLGLNVSAISAYSVPSDPGELEELIRLWEREAILSTSALLLDCNTMNFSDPMRANALARLIERVSGALIVSCRERLHMLQRPAITFDVPRPSTSEQRSVWQSALGAVAHRLNGQVDVLVSQFSLNVPAIYAASAELLKDGALAEDSDLGSKLWDACRRQARSRLDDLALHITPAATWNDLVVPEQQRQILREIAAHVRQRLKVYETWGFAARGARGLGISVLFSGASGTGKTMAAEVLANELRLDLYRIDLSQVVSKYIGETEKNLRRVFDAAEEGGAILLFDEADAMFGKRSEVKDSHDRYANIEVSYLLQRMEAYRGLAILTTNMKSALDSAFLRRIRFIVQFPFPDVTQRAEIWRRIFPTSTPTERLDIDRLARLNVAGGNIRNIALNAAFLAADVDEPVRMSHLLRAARSEYTKIEKPLTETEIGGWV